MSTLLDNSSRPIWVWIIVIVIGSICLVGTLALLVRVLIVRRRAKVDVEEFSDEPAEKKLTLRRGRTVPAASYLSLTGSRFGLNSFARDESLKSPSVRSKSPFEWWASVRGRTSRLSYLSQTSSVQYPSSPRRTSFYQKPDFSASKTSLASREENIVRATVTELHIAQPTAVRPSFKRSSRSFEPVNFSRSFTPQTQRSLAAYRNQTLSRIEENTPRQSYFSNASYRGRMGSYSSAEGERQPEIYTADRTAEASMGKIAPTSFPRKFRGSIRVESRPRLDNRDRSMSPPASPSRQPESIVTPDFPEARVNLASRRSLWDSEMKQFPSLTAHRNSIRSMDLLNLKETQTEASWRPETSELWDDDYIEPARAWSKRSNILHQKNMI